MTITNSTYIKKNAINGLQLVEHNKNKDVGNPDISHVDSINKHVVRVNMQRLMGSKSKEEIMKSGTCLPRKRPSTTTSSKIIYARSVEYFNQ